MAQKNRIYAVKIILPEPKVRLVKAANVNAAIRYVVDRLIYAELASQDTLVTLLASDVKVEDATDVVVTATQTGTMGGDVADKMVAE